MTRGRNPENLAGIIFNRLKVIEIDTAKKNRVHWFCKCDCGNIVSVAACDLKASHTKSCGCLNQVLRVVNNTKHGYTRTPTYNVWSNMHARCSNQNRRDFKNYGGRGISICERWNFFSNFLNDMGEKPNKLSLDRIDNNGNYEPKNCRWATASEQRKNQRAAAEIGRTK